MVQLVRHPQTKERDTDRLLLNHRATSRLYSHESKSEIAVKLAIFSTAPPAFWLSSRCFQSSHSSNEAGGLPVLAITRLHQ
jgi:hypothetical protein